jgi:hypothetical protein
MKTFKRANLPEVIHYNGDEYKAHIESSAKTFRLSDARKAVNRFNTFGCKAILVEVLPAKLKGVRDLHGQFYKPSTWIFVSSQADVMGSFDENGDVI